MSIEDESWYGAQREHSIGQLSTMALGLA